MDLAEDIGRKRGIMAKVTKSERDEALENLRGILNPGDTAFTILRAVSRSGMSRQIDVYAFGVEGGEVKRSWLSYQAALACGIPFAKEALRVGGCGMDMGFHVVYTMSRVLFPEGFGCIGTRCRSNDHSNGDRNRAKHSKRRPHWHKDGGYALRHEWI